jgi:hypothetical protein
MIPGGIKKIKYLYAKETFFLYIYTLLAGGGGNKRRTRDSAAIFFYY